MSTRKFHLTTIAALGWFALISQFYLIPNKLNFFGYFTILTNLLVASCVTFGMKKQKVMAATAVYITIVGAVYNLILRFTWDPQGLQKVTDELLHTVIPVWFVVFWAMYVPKNQLQWRDAFTWLIYPAAYSIFTVVRGAYTDWYPYPFIDPTSIGWTMTAINSVFVLIAFLVVSFVVIGVAKLAKPTSLV